MKIGKCVDEKNPVSAPMEMKAVIWMWLLSGSEDPPEKEILWMSTEKNRSVLTSYETSENLMQDPANAPGNHRIH